MWTVRKTCCGRTYPREVSSGRRTESTPVCQISKRLGRKMVSTYHMVEFTAARIKELEEDYWCVLVFNMQDAGADVIYDVWN